MVGVRVWIGTYWDEWSWEEDGVVWLRGFPVQDVTSLRWVPHQVILAK